MCKPFSYYSVQHSQKMLIHSTIKVFHQPTFSECVSTFPCSLPSLEHAQMKTRVSCNSLQWWQLQLFEQLLFVAYDMRDLSCLCFFSMIMGVRSGDISCNDSGANTYGIIWAVSRDRQACKPGNHCLQNSCTAFSAITRGWRLKKLLSSI